MDKIPNYENKGVFRASILMIVGGLLALCLVYAFAQRPRTVSQQERNRRASVNTKTITVKAGGNFQRALNNAQPGDTIVLDAGGTYTGPFALPVKSGSSYITIQSSAVSQLPASQRVSPAQAGLMAKLVSPGSGSPVIVTAAGAHHYALVGLEITSANPAAVIYDLLQFGSGDQDQNSMDKVPHDLVLDRCYVHALPGQPLKRGVALNSGETSITNSYLSDFKIIGQDAQAICGWNGPGPYHILNNYIEAAGNNILFGGATGGLTGVIPSDIEIRHNNFYKPVSWRQGDPSFAGVVWEVKNLFEIKSARRVTIDGNVFENNWAQAQNGFAILFTVRNDSGPQAQIEDVTFTNNILRHSGNGMNIMGLDLVPTSGLRRLKIANNLFDDISKTWGGDGIFLQMLNGTVDVVVDHNTVWHDGDVILADGQPNQGFVFTNNIMKHNAYGVMGSGAGLGTDALVQYFPGCVFRKNVIAGADVYANRYPADNFYPAMPESNPASKLKRNVFQSLILKYKGRALNGKDVGCDLNQLAKATGVAQATED